MLTEGPTAINDQCYVPSNFKDGTSLFVLPLFLYRESKKYHDFVVCVFFVCFFFFFFFCIKHSRTLQQDITDKP